MDRFIVFQPSDVQREQGLVGPGRVVPVVNNVLDSQGRPVA